jgi:hypothetical protein
VERERFIVFVLGLKTESLGVVETSGDSFFMPRHRERKSIMNKAKHLLVSGEEQREEEQLRRYLVDIGHPIYVWLVQPETSSWSLIKKEEMGNALCDAQFFENLSVL